MDKQNAIKLLDETFSNDFDTHRFAKFIKELFNNFNINQKSWTVWSEYQDYIESYNSLGSYTDKSKKVIDVLIVKLKRTSSRDRARTMQRNFIAKYLGNADKDAALVAFYGDDEDWRFSFVKMEYNLLKDEEGKAKVAKELTPAKRYSFLVGINEPNHTCKRQFLELVMEDEINPSAEELEDAFSIDKVTKEFFIEYKELYLKLKDALERHIKKDSFIRKEFEENAISTVDFAKKLLGQIVFIYFLQKKGWLGVQKDKSGKFMGWGSGPKNFLRKLFEKKNYKNFFNDVLEPLFYEALATERDDDYYSRFECKIPFLNGGLFEPINEYNWRETDLLLDNPIFENILNTFDRFNFTVKEDEPLEKEVAIDPEILGKVFENLIEENIRKGQGAYYTPREIVHYMCQQSLINYLETNTGILREDVEKFIQLGDFTIDQEQKILIELEKKLKKYRTGIISKEIYEKESQEIKNQSGLPKSIKHNYQIIDKLLTGIKIVDPAVGSGAFPVGMMNEIVRARSILSIFFSDEEQKKRTNYNLKREIIENCLYGVDIDSSAVDIAKLRFWLSLIVDELDMKNIKPLPNLDYKIMCGNSLLEEFEGVKLFDDKLLGEVKKDYSFEINQINAEISKFNQELHQIHTGKIKNHNGRSKEIVNEIKKLQRKKEQILSAPKEQVQQATIGDSLQKKIKESQKKLKELRELQQKFFNEQNRKLKKQYRDDIERIEWELVEETLKEQGNEEAMKKLLQYKKNKSKPFFLWKLYFAEVFQRENPGFDVVIGNPPWGQKSVKFTEIEKEILKRNYPYSILGQLDIFRFFVEKSIALISKDGSFAFVLPDIILLKNYPSTRRFILDYLRITRIDHWGMAFENVNLDSCTIIGIKDGIRDNVIYCSVHTGSEIIRNKIPQNNFLKIEGHKFNLFMNESIMGLVEKLTKQGVFDNFFESHEGIHSGNIRDKLFVDKKIDNYSRKLIFGRDEIKKYALKWAGKWVNYNSSIINKNNGEYAGLGRPEYFDNEKIVVRRTGDYVLAALDEEGYYFSNNVFVCICKKKDSLNLKYALALLNSSLSTWFYRAIQPRKGKLFAELKINVLNQIPIKGISLEQQKPFIHLVDQILSITKDGNYLNNPNKLTKVKKLEKEIDQLVYNLYELNDNERGIIDESN